ncbi:MAG: prepilin-type N-terminal cleavage/methylation domain-containing protein, partial [Synergistaceae bacterium]|nr:prepilin-type N-terminal cleavage/methylation domain-containing protein [Synergistaceae bacterium]
MTGKISTEYKRFIRGNARGFSLVELLVVVLIMGVLVGVVGSLMGGFVANFEMTDDQSIARRRASDVFNILQVPLLNAGLGIPADNF